MQKDSIQEKNAKYFVKNPCKPQEACNYDEDFDPCGSTDDLTDKDLTILLREESCKVQSIGLENNDEYEFKGTEETEEEGERDSTIKVDEKKKKKVCKNFIKNPFFTNPFKFSSNLPPPPASPPPQFLPLAETDSTDMAKTCQKKNQKKKPCKKDTGESKTGGLQDTDGNGSDLNLRESGHDIDDKGVEADIEDEADDYKTDKGDKKKKCRRKSERPPCRKRVSEISISLLPRQIPALQRDLPPTSPKDIPEVERQVLMACGVKPDSKCKKRTEKSKVKK
ncbi:hypothetical protein RUM44_000465 [Polyplax serrata]|uniref:Uncharacterized protein n=1 Tax=Polyplax serrata TaxID=468196 RepID=A0ABR1B5K2_POLSC